MSSNGKLIVFSQFWVFAICPHIWTMPRDAFARLTTREYGIIHRTNANIEQKHITELNELYELTWETHVCGVVCHAIHQQSNTQRRKREKWSEEEREQQKREMDWIRRNERGKEINFGSMDRLIRKPKAKMCIHNNRR